MTTIDRAALRKLAEEARAVLPRPIYDWFTADELMYGHNIQSALCRHIAAASPSVVLGLLDEVDAATEAKQLAYGAVKIAESRYRTAEIEHDATRAALTRLRARVAELEGALKWYGEKASSLADNDWRKNAHYAEAIFTELSLDGGRRAAQALTQKETARD